MAPNKYNALYYRWASQDWGWTHGAIAGSGFSSMVLQISAWDVDEPAEDDAISVWNGASWTYLGDLTGTNNTWEFATFDLSGYAWAEAQANAGLQVKMDIDTGSGTWAVTLAKATLSVDGGSQDCVPTPGIPCTQIPEPTTPLLLGIGLVGLLAARKPWKTANRA